MQDGTRYSSRKGGAVTVADEHASAVQRYSGGDAAILNGQFRTFAGTQNGRWCPECRFLAQAWSLECPRCERRGMKTATIPESDMPAARSALPSGCPPVPFAAAPETRSDE